MQRLRGLFRLVTLTLLTLTLMAAMALPSSAAKVCSSTQMLPEVEIVSVEAKPSQVHWRPYDLVKFKYNGDIENGLLEVSFKDIATDFDFDGYIIEAMPGDDDPGNSKERGVLAHTSKLIARPAVVGDTVPVVLNLEPGTKYYVTVYAVNHNTVQISPDQRAQDSSSATTLLSAPFLGALHAVFQQWENNSWGPRCNPLEARAISDPNTICRFRRWVDVGLDDDMTSDHNSDYEGAHFAFYDADARGQHYFRWLNPAHYGPYDHILDDVLDDLNGPDDSQGQADMLSLDKDGKVEDHCSDNGTTNGKDYNIANGNCGHTHYQFKAVDDNGNTVASELVETQGNLVYGQGDIWWEAHYFEVVFTAENRTLTLSVSLGRVDKGKYRAMSDTASVLLDVPDDLRAFDQTPDEYIQVLYDIHAGYDENDDLERWLGKDGTGADRSIWNHVAKKSFADAFHGPNNVKNDLTVEEDGDRVRDGDDDDDDYKGVMVAHLNNQLK